MGFFFISLKPRHGLPVGRGTGCFKPFGYFDEDCILSKVSRTIPRSSGSAWQPQLPQHVNTNTKNTSTLSYLL